MEYDYEYTLSKESAEEALREIKYFLEVNNCKWCEPREEHRYYDEIDSAKAIYFIYDGG